MNLGTWLSPWGGFRESGKQRVKASAAKGFEVHQGSSRVLQLAGPKYYESFRGLARDLVFKSGVRFLKLDGVGAGLGARGAGRFAEDADRLMQLTGELREDTATMSGGNRSDLWVTLSTGAWPSPFWLLSVDAIWRDGPDIGKEGSGSARQQWITFRDAAVYWRIVRRSPLFPLSDLALGGIIWSRAEEPGAYLKSYELEDFRSEVRSFFLSGTALQELQIQPELLTPEHWGILADAANVTRRYAAVLKDSHWAGGDPARGDVYGYAAFQCPPCLGIMSWRNPQAAPQGLNFTLRKTLALPRSWPGGVAGGHWRVRRLWPGVAKAWGLEKAPVAPEGGRKAEPGAWDGVPQPPLPDGPVAWDSVSLDEPLELQLKGLELHAFEAWPLPL